MAELILIVRKIMSGDGNRFISDLDLWFADEY